MIAILSDIHSNLHALDAVFNDMPEVSQIWLLGDSLGGFKYPCEVLDRLIESDVPVYSVIGNHEQSIIDEKYGKHPDWRMGTQFGTMVWTADRLKPYHWEYIEGLETALTVENISGNALLFHGTPDNLRGRIFTGDEAHQITTDRTEIIFTCGHTHQARMFKAGGQIVINPGSVGVALDGIGGVASYALLDDCKADPSGKVIFRTISYDLDGAIESVMKSELMECASGITRAIISEIMTGRFFVMSLVIFAFDLAEKHLGFRPDIVPPEIWTEAETKWDGSEWLPGRSQ